jgi:hypothetical protein
MTDSAGHDVLARRLQEKRAQVAQLLPMLECNPEMVAVAFHGGMRFANPEVMSDLAGLEPEDLPPWSTLQASVSLEPWAEDLARRSCSRTRTATSSSWSPPVWSTCKAARRVGDRPSGRRRPAARGDGSDEGEESDDIDIDLEEAGADWLSEQGFERKDRFSGDH